MADIRIKDLTTTASSTASDDFIAVDGTTNGTRKLNAFSPTFGGNVVVTGTLTAGSGSHVFGNSANTAEIKAQRLTTDPSSVALQAVASHAIINFTGDTGYTWGRIGSAGNEILRIYHAGLTSITAVAGGGLAVGGGLNVSATTASTTTSTGALVVSGGVGIGGSLNAGANNAANSITGGDAGSGTSILQLKDGLGSVKVNFKGNGDVAVQSSTASTSTSSGALVVSGGVGVAGNTNIGGVASIGGSSNASVGVYVINTALTGVDQYGVASEPIWTSAATAGHTIWARTKTAASAFTLTNGTAIYVEQPTLGSGSSITNNYGLRITNQGAAGVANAYGVDILAQSGASSTNVGLRNAGTTLLTNSTASTSTSSGALVVSGGVGVAGAVNVGGNLTVNGTITLYPDQDGFFSGSWPRMNFTTNGSSVWLSGATTGAATVQHDFRNRSGTSLLTLGGTGNAIFAGNLKTAAPAGGTAAEWKLGTVATVSPTSPNRTIEVDIGGTIYYIHAKTTNN